MIKISKVTWPVPLCYSRWQNSVSAVDYEKETHLYNYFYILKYFINKNTDQSDLHVHRTCIMSYFWQYNEFGQKNNSFRDILALCYFVSYSNVTQYTTEKKMNTECGSYSHRKETIQCNFSTNKLLHLDLHLLESLKHIIN